MWGSYSSYSSLSSTLSAMPMDISSPSGLNSRDSSCAFPSWPRRSSLDSEEQERPTSFLSDDDLLLEDPFEDDSRSIASSSGSSASSPQAQVPLTEEQLFHMQRERLALQRELMKHVVTEKERKRQSRKPQRKTTTTTKKSSPKSKLSNMTPIQEAHSSFAEAAARHRMTSDAQKLARALALTRSEGF